MKRFAEFIQEDVSQKEINDLEKFADRLLNKFDVDIEFTKHFADRVNDKRNKPGITIAELQRLFKKMAANKGKKIKKHGNSEAILKDMQSDLNLPVVVNWKNGEFEVVNKTIMRKKAFKSPDPAIRYESQVNEGTDKLISSHVRGDLKIKTVRRGTSMSSPIFVKVTGGNKDHEMGPYKSAAEAKTALNKMHPLPKRIREAKTAKSHPWYVHSPSSFKSNSKMGRFESEQEANAYVKRTQKHMPKNALKVGKGKYPS